VTKKVLDLGSGTKKRPGATTVDINVDTAPDVVHDLNVFPYPFPESEFDEIYADNVLEHLDDVVLTMQELHRITRDGGLVTVYVPYFRSTWAAIDPTHRHHFTAESMSYFDIDHPFHDQYRYSPVGFRVRRVVFNERWTKPAFRARVAGWATRHPQSYERRLSHVFPLDELTFVLEVVKPAAS